MTERQREHPPWSWHGVTAVILAVCVGGGWLAGVILAALEAVGARGLDTTLAGLLNGIGQVLAGALGTYLGFAAGTATKTTTPPGSSGDTDAMPPGGVVPITGPDSRPAPPG